MQYACAVQAKFHVHISRPRKKLLCMMHTRTSFIEHDINRLEPRHETDECVWEKGSKSLHEMEHDLCDILAPVMHLK